MAEAEDVAPSCTFFKKPMKNRNMRKRASEGDVEEKEEGVIDGSAVVHKMKASKSAVLGFSTGNGPASRQRASEEDSVQNGDLKAGTFFFESSREVQTQTDQRATATLETETAFDRDARAIRERVLRQADEALKGSGSSDMKVYKGMNAYVDHKAGFRRENTIAGEKAGGAHGPLRASAHIRWSVRFDYQPDICKDYKETGYCGYGDSCKFMHDRGDYKSGWQMEKEWDESQKKKREQSLKGSGEEDGSDSEVDEDGIPFACLICRKSFQEPVVTRCKHYFCEHCALRHYSKNKNCAVCNKPTNGVFNTAHDVLKKMKEAKVVEDAKER